jgi:hypothetical protein
MISVPKSLDHGGHGELSDLCVKGFCSRGHRQVHLRGSIRLTATGCNAPAQRTVTSNEEDAGFRCGVPEEQELGVRGCGLSGLHNLEI